MGREECEGENAFDAKKCSDPNLIALMFFCVYPSFNKIQDPPSNIIPKYGKWKFTFIKGGWYGKLNKTLYFAYSLIQDPPQPSFWPIEGPLFSPPPPTSDLNNDWSLIHLSETFITYLTQEEL